MECTNFNNSCFLNCNPLSAHCFLIFKLFTFQNPHLCCFSASIALVIIQTCSSEQHIPSFFYWGIGRKCSRFGVYSRFNDVPLRKNQFIDHIERKVFVQECEEFCTACILPENENNNPSQTSSILIQKNLKELISRLGVTTLP